MGIKRRGGTAPARSAARPAAAPAPAQSNPAPVQHTPSPAPTAHSAPAAAPAHHAPQQQPMMQQQQPMMQQPQSGGGGFLSNVAGGIMNGMTFGVGSAVANRAVDAVFGPRTMQVEHVNTNAAPATDAPAAAPAAAPAPMMQQPSMMQSPSPVASGVCSTESEYFNRCMQLNNNSLDACSSYSTALQHCQRSGH